jgi:hypothetical protein
MDAAVRYVRLRGQRSRLDPPGAAAVAGRGSEHRGKVAGFRPGGNALVRLDDGRAVEVPLREGIRNRFEVGSPALVYFDDTGILMGWYLPDAGIGVHMQGDG